MDVDAILSPVRNNFVIGSIVVGRGVSILTVLPRLLSPISSDAAPIPKTIVYGKMTGGAIDMKEQLTEGAK